MGVDMTSADVVSMSNGGSVSAIVVDSPSPVLAATIALLCPVRCRGASMRPNFDGGRPMRLGV